jgi:hypothetical protein
MKSARFYCEFCEREVPINATTCPHCKKSFSAVKCPVCSFTGKPELFEDGCPSCGYLGTGTDTGARRRAEKRRGGSADVPSTGPGEPPVRKGLPGWLYGLVFGILIFAFLILMFVYLQL